MPRPEKFHWKFILIYSFLLSVFISIAAYWYGIVSARDIYDLSANEFPMSQIFDSEVWPTLLWGLVQSTLMIFLYWLFVRWVASKAQRAGRSYAAFMVLALVLPPVAWIIAITFRSPNLKTSGTEIV